MRKLYFLIFLFLSFYVFGQTPFIIKIEKTADGLFIPITRDEDTYSNSLKYRLTVKNGTTTLINDQTSTVLEPNLDIARGRKNHLKSSVIMSVPDGTILTLEFKPLANASPAGFYGLKLGTSPSYDSTFGTDIDKGILRADFAPYAATIREITQWGNGLWHRNLHEFLAFTTNLKITATDKPNLSNVEFMPYAFYQSGVGSDGASAVPGIGSWDLSSLKGVSYMFAEAEYFNEDIGNWNVGNVINMYSMFDGAKSFNQDISRWNVANVTNMGSMFENTTFNQNIGLWGTKTNKVTDMQSMFSNNSVFNQDISGWDVSNVTSMNFMFSNATAFNQPIGNWNTAKVKGMQFMFQNAIAFNQPLNWKTGEVILAGGMFEGATSFNQPIGNWNTAKMTTFGGIFSNATSFNQPLNWNTSLGRYFDEMFSGATSFNQSLSTFNFSAATNVEDMLKQSNIDCENLANTLIGWAANPSHASKTNLNFGDLSMPDGVSRRRFISSAHNAFVTLSGKDWVIDALEDPTCAPYDPTKFIIKVQATAEGIFIPAIHDIRSVNAPKDMKDYKLTIKKGTTIVLPTITSAVLENDARYTKSIGQGQRKSHLLLANNEIGEVYTLEFTNNLYSLRVSSQLETPNNDVNNNHEILEIVQCGSQVKWNYNMSFFMAYTPNLVATATDTPDFSNVTTMYHMFKSARAFGAEDINLNMNSWDVSKVTNMLYMFQDADVFNQDIGNWDTKSVTDMSYMFQNAKKFNQYIGNWNTSSVIQLVWTFGGAKAFNQDISEKIVGIGANQYKAWDVSKVLRMNFTFEEAEAFDQPIGNWNTSSVEGMSGMFRRAKAFKQDIGNWNTQGVTSMAYMFQEAISFNQNIGNWNTNSLENTLQMFKGATSFNQDISTKGAVGSGSNQYNPWNVSKVTSMADMFSGATSFNQNLGSWKLDAIGTGAVVPGSTKDMFYQSDLDCDNFTNTLVGWAVNYGTKVLNIGNVNRVGDVKRTYGLLAKNIFNTLVNGSSPTWTITNTAYDEFCGRGCTKSHEGRELGPPGPPTMTISMFNSQDPLAPARKMDNSFIGFVGLQKGLVLPRLASEAAIKNPQPGMLFYDTSAKCLKLYSPELTNKNMSTWKCVEKTCPPTVVP